MTLIGMRRALLALASMVFIVIMGGRIWLGDAVMSDVTFPGFMTFLILVLLAEIVARVEARIAELEKKLK